MSYRLTVKITDMSYDEAKALAYAITERFGSLILEEAIKAWHHECDLQKSAPVDTETDQ